VSLSFWISDKMTNGSVQPYFLNTDAWDSCKRQLTSYNGRVKGFVRERYATGDGSL